MAEAHDYTVLKDGWVAGRPRKAGDSVALTPAQAKYERVEPVKKPAGKSAAKSGGKPASSGD